MIVDGDRAWEVLRDHPRLAIVARSKRTDRPWHDVAGYLIAEGYDVQLVNTMLDEAHGRPCYDSLADLPEPFDIVDVFRMVPEVPGVVDEAIEVGAPIPVAATRDRARGGHREGVGGRDGRGGRPLHGHRAPQAAPERLGVACGVTVSGCVLR